MATGLIVSGSTSTNSPSPIFRYIPNSTAKIIINMAGNNATLSIYGITCLQTTNSTISATLYFSAGQQFTFSFAGNGGYVVSALEESS